MITRAEKNKKIQDEIIKEEATKKFKKISKIIIISFLSITSIILYGIFIGSKIVIINEFKIQNNKITESFHGTKVVHISDILYDSLNSNDLKKIANQINEIEPDIIIFTGNIFTKKDLNQNELTLLENFFKSLNSKFFKYAINGKYDDNSFNVIMENSNFKILNNKQELLYYKDIIPIEIIGFDSNNLKFDNIKDSNNFKICIFSNPDKIDEILKNTKCDLALASETLGGEIKLFNYPLLDNHTYNKDYYKINETDFYISNGLGNLSKVRYFNHPSINFFRLTK